MRAMLEEYGMTIIMIILGSGIVGLLLYILEGILSGRVFGIWGS